MTEDSTNVKSDGNNTDVAVIAELEQRIVALETGNQYDVNQAAIETVEMKHLQTLRDIRTALLNEQDTNANTNNTNSTTATAVSANNGSDHSIMESLQKENDSLKKKMIKLEYRIQHLVTNMDLLYEKSTSA